MGLVFSLKNQKSHTWGFKELHVALETVVACPWSKETNKTQTQKQLEFLNFKLCHSRVGLLAFLFIYLDLTVCLGCFFPVTQFEIQKGKFYIFASLIHILQEHLTPHTRLSDPVKPSHSLSSAVCWVIEKLIGIKMKLQFWSAGISKSLRLQFWLSSWQFWCFCSLSLGWGWIAMSPSEVLLMLEVLEVKFPDWGLDLYRGGTVIIWVDGCWSQGCQETGGLEEDQWW